VSAVRRGPARAAARPAVRAVPWWPWCGRKRCGCRARVLGVLGRGRRFWASGGVHGGCGSFVERAAFVQIHLDWWVVRGYIVLLVDDGHIVL